MDILFKWGEIPAVSDTEPGIAALEREQITKMRPMDVEGPRLHQPSSRHYPPAAEPYPAEYFALDSVTAHSIQLLQHARKVRQLISSYQQSLDTAKTQDTEPPPASPVTPIPPYEGESPKHQWQKPVPFLPWNRDSDFSLGIGKPPPEIDASSCRKLLRRSTAAILAHTGYETSPDSLLETMTDLCQEYITRMCGLMRQAVDAEARTGTTGFQDVMEQVFHEMDIGPTTALYDFYQTRILNYHEHLVSQCEQLQLEYERISNPELRAAEESKLARMKEEFNDIQFPSTDESEEAVDADSLIQLEESAIKRETTCNRYGLGGFEVSIVQEGSGLSSEEESRWQPAQGKQDHSEARLSQMDSSYEHTGDDGEPSTPQFDSESGEV